MRAVQISRFGGPEVLELVDLPDPQPGPGEVVLAVTAKPRCLVCCDSAHIKTNGSMRVL